MSYCYATLGDSSNAINCLSESIGMPLDSVLKKFGNELVVDGFIIDRSRDIASTYKVLFNKTGNKNYLDKQIEILEKVIPSIDYAILLNRENTIEYRLTQKFYYLHDLILSLSDLNKIYGYNNDTSLIQAIDNQKSILLKKQKHLDMVSKNDTVIEKLRNDISTLQLKQTELESFNKNGSGWNGQPYINLLRDINIKTQELSSALGLSKQMQLNTQFTAKKIQKALKPGQAVLDYYWTMEMFICSRITKDSIKTFISKPDFGKLDLVAKLINKFQSQNDSINISSAMDFNVLYDYLIKQFIDVENYKSITIIPDFLLSEFPFEALITELPDTSRKNWQTNIKYLGDKEIIKYNLSLSLLHNENNSDTLLASDIYAFAPEYRNANTKKHNQTNLSYNNLQLRNAIGPLKYNKQEVSGISSGRSATVFIGQDATEENFKKINFDNKVIHLAMHGFYSEQEDDYSGLAFEPSKDYDTLMKDNNADTISTEVSISEDGILHAYEVYGMKINSPLVVLSACETGTGNIKSGEGVMSLARAFTYAGADNIITSLWKVDDVSTKEIMTNFYNNLGIGIGKADALAKAKRTFRKDHPSASPFYWAPFILIGDNEPVNIKQKSSTGLWVLIGFIIITIAFIITKRKIAP